MCLVNYLLFKQKLEEIIFLFPTKCFYVVNNANGRIPVWSILQFALVHKNDSMFREHHVLLSQGEMSCNT